MHHYQLIKWIEIILYSIIVINLLNQNMNHTLKTSRFKTNLQIILNPISKNQLNIQNQSLQTYQINQYLIQNLIKTVQISSFIDSKLRTKIIYYLQQFNVRLSKEQTIRSNKKTQNKSDLMKNQLKYLSKTSFNLEQNYIQNNCSQQTPFQKSCFKYKRTIFRKKSQLETKILGFKPLDNKFNEIQSQIIQESLQRIQKRIKAHQSIICELKNKLVIILQLYKVETKIECKNNPIKSQIFEMNSNFKQVQEKIKQKANITQVQATIKQRCYLQQLTILRQKLVQRESQIKYLWMTINHDKIFNKEQVNFKKI